MSPRVKRLTGRLRRSKRTGAQATEPRRAAPEAHEAEPEPLDIPPNDPIIGLFESAEGPVYVDDLELDSPALERMREAGVRLAVPLVSQAELIGVLNLGPRLSEQDYSSDDRKLLANLAVQAAPAVRVGQLVRQQEAEARSRKRIEQELRVAQLIEQNFLPKQLPDLPGWQVAAYTQVVCMDRPRQWKRAGNVWQSSAIRSTLYMLGAPLRLLRRRKPVA